MSTCVEMTKAQFATQIANKNGNFRNRVFNFQVTLHHSFDFKLDFSNSVFNEKFSASHASFAQEVSFLIEQICMEQVHLKELSLKKWLTL